jgi:RiboL-PSP-HEPN
MKNVEISRQLQSLKALMKSAAESTQDPELLSHWARYFSVVAAGLLQNAITEIYTEYVTRAASGPVSNYARSRLATIQNPKADKFVEVARNFDVAWAAELETFLGDKGRKEAIDSIMNVRHQIAHGKFAGITYARISEYLKKAEEVIEFIEQEVRPN